MIAPIKVLGDNATHDPTVDSDGPMNEVQAAKLRTLCEKLNEPMDGNLTHRQAHERIEYLESVLKG